MILKNTKEWKRFYRFAIVGVSGTIVDFSVFNILANLFSLEPVIASVFSFSFGLLNNFIWNRHWTFPESKSSAFIKQMMQFGTVSLIGLAIRTSIFALIEKPITSILDQIIRQNMIISSRIIGYNLALAISITFVLFWNFLANRYWTYKKIK